MPLPMPAADLQQHSQILFEQIRVRSEDQTLCFDDYMQMALYQPGLGYYVSGLTKLGAAGDFTTAPELGYLFGTCIANQCAEVFGQLSGPCEVMELGAGTGRLAVAVLTQLQALDALPQRYFILEVSPDLQQRQRQCIADELPELVQRVSWLQSLPEQPINGVILANEVLDAIPCKRLLKTEAGWQQAVVSVNGGVLEEGEVAFDATLLGQLQTELLQDFPVGSTTEVNPQAQAWVATLGQSLNKGAVLLVDYGFPAHEYYHPDRTMGTLMCHYQHQAHDDPYWFPGLQDITAHVDFTAMADAGIDAGLDLLGYCQQANFCLAAGILQAIPDDASTLEQLKLSQEVKKLTLPHEMGELFKVIAFGKHLPQPLSGFTMDQSHRLWTSFK